MKEYGEGIIVLGLLIWISVSVGPWWVGVILFMGAMIFNLLVRLATTMKEKKL